MSYESNTYNESMLSHDMLFNLSDFFVEAKDDDLNLDESIINCEAISHESSRET